MEKLHQQKKELGIQKNTLLHTLEKVNVELKEIQKEIQNLCDHNFEREITYGERTKHICIHCNYEY